jgi:hypothetical protein
MMSEGRRATVRSSASPAVSASYKALACRLIILSDENSRWHLAQHFCASHLPQMAYFRPPVGSAMLCKKCSA